MTTNDITEALQVLKSNSNVSKWDNYRAYSVVAEVLQKQIPMKPKSSIQSGKNIYYNCPSCGFGFIYSHQRPFCYICGQRIDWSDIVK